MSFYELVLAPIVTMSPPLLCKLWQSETLMAVYSTGTLFLERQKGLTTSHLCMQLDLFASYLTICNSIQVDNQLINRVELFTGW